MTIFVTNNFNGFRVVGHSSADVTFDDKRSSFGAVSAVNCGKVSMKVSSGISARRIILSILVFFVFADVAFAAQSDTTSTRTPAPYIVADTTNVNIVAADSTRISLPGFATDTTSATPAKPDVLIKPFNAPERPGAIVIESDSTLRWNKWLEFSELQHRRAGVITHRLGGFNRNDLMYVHGRRANQQHLYFEGMLATDPVTGRSRYAHLPIERISEITESGNGLHQRIDTELLRFYTPKPLTRISYQQSFYEMRSTDAMISRMLDRRTGLELVYHGKNNGAEYARMATEGRQMAARYFRHLDERHLVQTMIMYNGAEHMEPDGYNISNLSGFNFSRFFANPLRMNANSRERSLQIQAAWLRKSRDSDLTTTRAMVYYDQYRRVYRTAADSSHYRWKSFNAAASHRLSNNWFSATGEVQARYYMPDHNMGYSLNHSNWSELVASVHGRLLGKTHSTHTGSGSSERVSGTDIDDNAAILVPGDQSATQITGRSRYSDYLPAFPFSAQINSRSDGLTGWEMVAGVDWSLVGRVRLMADISQGETLPTMQQLYWVGSVTGNRDLGTEPWRRIQGGAEFGNPDQGIHARLRVHLTHHDRLHTLMSDSTFTSARDLRQQGGFAEITFNSTHWEANASITVLEYDADGTNGPAQILATAGTRIWNRVSLHRKGYVLGRAAYVKAGVYGIFSPNSYRPPAYLAVADLWTESHLTPPMPGFFRMDADLSARVRNMIVLVRMENLTQGLGQNGYYETAPYPMPSRRLHFGLRVLFSN